MAYSAKITEVVSGSSFRIDGALVIMQGAEAPRFDGKNAARTQSGWIAREWLRTKLAQRTVRIEEVKVLQDSPKRVLANVFIGSSYVNEQVLKSGIAKPNESRMTKYMSEKQMKLEELAELAGNPDLSYEERCYAASAKAQVEKAGLFDPKFEEKASKLEFQDQTKKGPELTRFIESMKGKRGPGFIDSVRDADSFYISVQDGNVISKFVGVPFGVETKNSDIQKKELEGFVQRSCEVEVMSNPQSNLVACMLYYKQKSGELCLSTYLIDCDCSMVIEWMVSSSPYASMFGLEKKTKKVKKQKEFLTLEVGSMYQAKVIDV